MGTKISKQSFEEKSIYMVQYISLAGYLTISGAGADITMEPCDVYNLNITKWKQLR